MTILPRPDDLFEAAFFTTDDGPVWTNLSDYVELQEGITAGKRRQNVFDNVAPAVFSAYLDNSDGVFNNDKADSPFVGKVTLNVAVRWRVRWPVCPSGTANMLSDIQSLASDAGKFTCEQGSLSIDADAEMQYVDDTDGSVSYSGTWEEYTGSGFYNGSEHSSKTTGSVASFAFTGTTVKWYGDKALNRGIANVSVDGDGPTQVDCYNATELPFSLLYTRTGLTNTTHTITVTCSGTKNPSSNDYWVDVDAFEYGTTATPPSGMVNDLIWNTGVLDKTGICLLSGSGSTRGPGSKTDYPIYVKPNTTYNVRIQVKDDANGTGINFAVKGRIRWYDIEGQYISDTDSASSTTLTTSYQSIMVGGTSPSNAHTMRIGVVTQTLVGPVTRAIAFSGGDSKNQRNSKGISITVPASASVGDAAFAWLRESDKNLTVTTVPTGWTLENSYADTKGKTYLYKKILNAADINKGFQWFMSAKTKQLLLLTCYNGVDQTTPIHNINGTAETTYQAAHTTPGVTTTINNCWILSAVFDLSTTTTSWSAPSGEIVEAIEYVTGGNAVTGLATDDGVGHAAGVYGYKVFTANVSSRCATMHTIALTPASGTGPGNVTVQLGKWEVVEGSLGTWAQGGHWVSKFTGLVDSWSETFHGELTLMEIQATDRQKQLNQIMVGSAVAECILTRNPIAYYKLDEISSGIDTIQEAGNYATTIQGNLTQKQVGTGGTLSWGEGVGPPVDGTAALVMSPVDVNNGIGLYSQLTNVISDAKAVTLVLFWKSTMSTGTNTPVFIKLMDATKGGQPRGYMQIRGKSGDSISARGYLNVESTTCDVVATKSASYFTGVTRCLAATFKLEGGLLVVTLYIDGSQVAQSTAACAISEFPTLSLVTVGYAGDAYLCSGTYSHAVFYDYELNSDDIADIATAGSTAFAGDTIDQRINRLANWMNQSGLDLDSSLTVVSRHIAEEQTGQSAVQQAASSEGGTAYIDGDGNITFKSRITKESTYTPLITISAAGVDPGSFVKITDDALLINKPQIKLLGTQAVTTMIDQDSVNSYGMYQKDFDTILSSNVDAQSRASLILAYYSQPKPHCDQVIIDGLLLQDWANVILADIWEIIRITDLPDVEQSSTLDLYIEGWEIRETPDSWWLTFDTSTVIPFGILNDTTIRGHCGEAIVGW